MWLVQRLALEISFGRAPDLQFRGSGLKSWSGPSSILPPRFINIKASPDYKMNEQINFFFQRYENKGLKYDNYYTVYYTCACFLTWSRFLFDNQHMFYIEMYDYINQLFKMDIPVAMNFKHIFIYTDIWFHIYFIFIYVK